MEGDESDSLDGLVPPSSPAPPSVGLIEYTSNLWQAITQQRLDAGKKIILI